jgi:hypothetical protein
VSLQEIWPCLRLEGARGVIGDSTVAVDLDVRFVHRRTWQLKRSRRRIRELTRRSVITQMTAIGAALGARI